MFECSPFTYYLIGINIAGFILFLINTLLYTYTAEGQIDAILTIVSFLGGSLGIVLSILIFDRKAVKDNMMSRVFVFTMLVIQIVIVLVVKGHIADDITLRFWDFFAQHKILMIYIVVMNFVTMAAFAMDKIAAIERRSRIRIVTLLGMAFAGGSIGGLIAMYLFRHKTRIDFFTVGIPLIILMQAVLVFYLMNAAWQIINI